jgi:hypothetical protein
MKPLNEYNWRNWQRLRPVTHWLKTLRYNAERNAYVRRPARVVDAALNDRIRARRVLVTIAFDDPEAIDMRAYLLPATSLFLDTDRIVPKLDRPGYPNLKFTE